MGGIYVCPGIRHEKVEKHSCDINSSKVPAACYPETEMTARSWWAARAMEHPLVRVWCI